MDRVVAEKDLEMVMTNLVPFIPFLSKKSCKEAKAYLVNLLKEALDGQEASRARGEELKEMRLNELVELFSPANGKGVRLGAAAASPSRGGGGKKREVTPKRSRPTKEKEKRRSPLRTRRKAAEKAEQRMDQDQKGKEEEDDEQAPTELSAVKKTKKALFAWNGEEVGCGDLLGCVRSNF